MTTLDLNQLKASPEYQHYHALVVQACVTLMGENARTFFRDQCDFIEEFLCCEDPNEVAENQQDSL